MSSEWMTPLVWLRAVSRFSIRYHHRFQTMAIIFILDMWNIAIVTIPILDPSVLKVREIVQLREQQHPPESDVLSLLCVGYLCICICTWVFLNLQIFSQSNCTTWVRCSFNLVGRWYYQLLWFKLSGQIKCWENTCF